MYKKLIPVPIVISPPKKAKSTISARTAKTSKTAKTTKVRKARTSKAKSTKARSTRARSAKAKSTRAKSTRAKSTRAKSTRAKSTRAKSTRANSTKAKSTRAKSTKSMKIKKSPKKTPISRAQLIEQLNRDANIFDKRLQTGNNRNYSPIQNPPTIMFRVNYTKKLEAINRAESFKTPPTSNEFHRILAIATNKEPLVRHRFNHPLFSTHSTSFNEFGRISSNMKNNSREEFYKYLGIDTNPTPEKQPSPESIANDSNSLNNQRRSLRVIIQQKQIESTTKSSERLMKSPDIVSPNGIISRAFGQWPNQISVAKSVRKMSHEFDDLHDNAKLRKFSSMMKLTDSPFNRSTSTLASIDMISNQSASHIMQRRSYDRIGNRDGIGSAFDRYNSKVLSSQQQLNNSNAGSISGRLVDDRPTQQQHQANGCFIKSPNQTESKRLESMSNSQMNAIECDVNGKLLQRRVADKHIEETVARPKDRKKVFKRRIFVPNAITLNHILKRYKQCLRHERAFKTNLQNVQQRLGSKTKKRTALRPIVNVQCNAETKLTIKSNHSDGSKVDDPIACEPSTSTTIQLKIDKIDNDLNGNANAGAAAATTVARTTTNNANRKNDMFVSPSEEQMNTFSPNSITHSTASTDSAIVINHLNEPTAPITVAVTTSKSLEWHHDQTKSINKFAFVNPLNATNGPVLAILTHSSQPNENDIIVVVQKSLVSYWCAPSKVLRMFGAAQTWIPIGQIRRMDNGQFLNI